MSILMQTRLTMWSRFAGDDINGDDINGEEIE